MLFRSGRYAEAFQNLEAGYGFATFYGGDGHFAALAEATADGGVDFAGVFLEFAAHEGEVVTIKGVFAGLSGEVIEGGLCFGDDHDAGGVAVEAVEIGRAHV